MDANTHKKMIDFAQQVIDLSPKDQNLFFRYIVDAGILSKDEADGLRIYVATAHLFLDADYYEAVKNAVKEKIINDFYGRPA